MERVESEIDYKAPGDLRLPKGSTWSRFPSQLIREGQGLATLSKDTEPAIITKMMERVSCD